MKQQDHDALILNHYSQIARSFGTGPKSTMEDETIRAFELNFFQQEIEKVLLSFSETRPFKILELGCGNAYTLFTLAQILGKKFPFRSFEWVGLEFTPALWQCSQEQISKEKISNTSLGTYLGDARDPSHLVYHLGPYDVILSERFLINLSSKKIQDQVIGLSSQTLASFGKILLCESFEQPLVELNRARKEMCLEPLEQSYQNLYLTEELLEIACSRYGLKVASSILPENFLSTHFFISRVFHKLIRPKGGKVKFSHFAQFFSKGMPPAIGNYSPILGKVLQKMS